jgi:hypothetical protein
MIQDAGRVAPEATTDAESSAGKGLAEWLNPTRAVEGECDIDDAGCRRSSDGSMYHESFIGQTLVGNHTVDE